MHTKRFSNYDLLRILACFMVIVIHFSCLYLGDLSHKTLWTLSITYDSFSRSSVPLFFMLSGAFLLVPDKPVTLKVLFKRILRLLIPLLFWEVLYYGRNLLSDGLSKDTLLPFIQSIISAQNHFWYIPTLIGLYLLIPVLKQITKEKEVCEYFLVIWILFAIFRNTLLLLAPVIEYHHHYTGNALSVLLNTFCYLELTSYAGYFILGYYLVHHFKKKIPLSLLLLTTFLSALLCAEINFIVSYHILNTAWAGMQNYMSLTTFIEALCLFLIFKDYVAQITLSERCSSIITWIGACTFGIYLMHPLFTEKLYFLITDANAVFMIPVLSLAVFLLCLLVTSLLKCIPLVKKYLV